MEKPDKPQGARNWKHGLSKTPTYWSWSAMIRRCYVPTEYRYDRYGGRGISVCDRWRASFLNFLEDMGERPDGKSIDRIDNDGNYSPENCRWATQEEQCANTSASVTLTINGESDTMAGWSKRTGLSWDLIRGRKRKGWSDEDILTKPPGARSKVDKHAYNGKLLTIPEWSKETGIPRNVLGNRIRSGMTIEDAISKPYRKSS